MITGHRFVLAVLGALAVLGCSPSVHGAIEPVVQPASPDEQPDEETFLSEIDRTMGYRDIFTGIADPEFVTATTANLLPGEMVLGLDLGDARFAYPVNLLNHHEIVEHTVDGRDLLVCW